MKYYDETTQTYKEISIKALDSMPVGSIVDYDGQASDIPVGWQQQGNDYSTDEVDTGKTWIGGKKIYRKVIDCGSITGGKNVAHNISNISRVVDIKGTGLRNNGVWIPIPYANTEDTYQVQVQANNTNVIFDKGSNLEKITNVLITIEYIKTTD